MGDRLDEIPDEWRAAANDLVTRGEAVREAMREVLSDVVRLRDDAEALWNVGNWARMYYDTNDARFAATECLSMVQDLHESDGEPSPFCSECGHGWPCATVRLIQKDATT